MIANPQAQFCIEIANPFLAISGDMTGDKELIESLVAWTNRSASQIAKDAGLTPSTLTRPLNQPVKHRLSTPTIEALRKAYPDFPGFTTSLRDRQLAYRPGPDQADTPAERDYVPVEVLPTFAGMGGGGTGDGDSEIALIPRALIEDVLRGRADDFLLINVRGDSMEPDFHHGDQLLVDKRDTSPAQPGPFALWDGDWGEYVVKNVERARSGEVRIFSSNGKYSAESAPSETTRIIGRPVWFGRRL